MESHVSAAPGAAISQRSWQTASSEVSEDARFGNEYLAHHPFPAWADEFADEYRLLGPGFMQTLGENRFDGEPR